MPKWVQWVNNQTRRADNIPSEKWEAHKTEICRLYQQHTIDDIIGIMKRRHAFIAK